jgi:hypothetical protein
MVGPINECIVGEIYDYDLSYLGRSMTANVAHWFDIVTSAPEPMKAPRVVGPYIDPYLPLYGIITRQSGTNQKLYHLV